MATEPLSDKEIFNFARRLDSREAVLEYLKQVCSDDMPRRERILTLVKADKGDSFLEKPPVRLPETIDKQSLERCVGRMIGPYKIMEQIGEGGMGTVFVAQQEEPIRRKVALKLIKPGMDTKAVVARFEAERQALAMMDHPNIAKVLDAGTTAWGHPYFAMELVKGVPITEYCDHNRLSVHDRLKLFIQVCQAIQHAHQKGIIHRDVKPSNVLVTLHDGQPVPKIIDFGVAKALNARLTDKTLYTAHFQVVGTLLYMSPEQAELSGLDVDTRSDIYSLGVLLYELLTSTTPFPQATLAQAGFDEQRRIIREEEPPRASVRISSLGATATMVASHRSTDAKHLNQMIKGDLDWILLKALEKDRTRRYETAIGFANDVLRYLNDEPLAARPPSSVYRFKKYARRNKGLVASLVSAFVGVVVLMIALGYHVSTLTKLLEQKESLVVEKETLIVEVEEERDRAKAYLASLADELTDRAVDAAFSNRKVEFQEAIEKAELAKVPDDVIQAILGLHAFIDGDNEKALRLLQQASEKDPKSIAALSALAWVCHHLNYQMEREEATKRFRSLAVPSKPKPYEEFFLALVSFVGGSQQDLQRTLSRLDGLLVKRSRWGAAYALRAGVQMELAMETKRLEDFETAISDFKKAQDILPESNFVKTVGLYVLTTGIEFATARGQPQAEWMTAATEIAENFSKLSDGSAAQARASVFFYQTGDEERGEKIESNFVTRVPSVSEKVGIRIMHGEPLAEISKSLSNLQDNPEAHLTLMLVNALQSEQGELIAENQLTEFLNRDDVPDVLYVLALDLPYLLGRSDLAKKIIREKDLHDSVRSEWRWYRYVLDYHTGINSMTEANLLDKAEPFSNAEAMANYAIALKAMGDGETEKAKQFFRYTIATRRVGWWNYHWAKVYLNYLERAPTRSR